MSKAEKRRHPDYRKLHIYKRENSAYWQCRFHHKGTPYRESTKQTDLSKAEAFAANWYEEKLGEIRDGVLIAPKKKTGKPTIKDASILAINELREKVENDNFSIEYLRGVTKVMGNYISPTTPKNPEYVVPGKFYLGDIPCDEITNAVWKEFQNSIKLQRKNEGKKPLARKTFYQIRNALNLCLNVALDKEWITEIPKLKEASHSTKKIEGRVWFEPREQKRLLKALQKNIEDLEHTRHHQSAMELRDYVEFMLYSGLRVGESRNIQFRDIHIKYLKPESGKHSNTGQTLIIRNIVGKRGVTYECLTRPEAVIAFESIKKRRGIKNHKDCEEPLFLENHRTGFNAVLKKLGMKTDRHGRRRDFVSLRHTYICNMIRNKISVFLIATNCRTSVEIIEKHYAKPMKISLNAAELLQTMDKM